MASNPYLIVRRIMEGKQLWGVKLKYQNTLYKMTKERLAQTIQNKIKTVLVDLKQGDQPVELIMYNDTQFRTIKDGHLCNNFNKLKAIKLVSANKLRVKT